MLMHLLNLLHTGKDNHLYVKMLEKVFLSLEEGRTVPWNINHSPPTPPGNSGDFDFWSSKSPLKGGGWGMAVVTND